MYPGTFNPPTRAHLEIAAAARHQHRLDRIDLSLSRVTLGKESLERPTLEDRVAVLREDTAQLDWLGVVVTDFRLIADIARGYDVVVMGADKWAQVNDPAWYDSEADRDRAVAGLPVVAVAPRPPHPVPTELELVVGDDLADMSSTAARGGARAIMSPAAIRFDDCTGAWSDPDRYERWLQSNRRP